MMTTERQTTVTYPTRPIAFSFILTLLLSLQSPALHACSRVLWADNDYGVIVGRSQDWPERVQSNWHVFPRGIDRRGLAGANSLQWTSRYGSLVITGYDVATHEGLNEKGLSARMLFLKETDFGERDPQRPGLSIVLWAQYYLDNFATVAEAVQFMRANPDLQIVPIALPTGHTSDLHISLEDGRGDSAIIEFIEGRATIYHNRQHTVMTNSPTFDQQLARQSRYQPFGGDLPLPGSRLSPDRFIRAAHYLQQLPNPQGEREAVFSMFGVMNSVSVPAGLSEPGAPNHSRTQWRSVMNLSQGNYYFQSTDKPNTVWANIHQFDLTPGAPELQFVTEDKRDLSGDVSKQFIEAEAFVFKTSL